MELASPEEPTRPADTARLAVARLSIEKGVTLTEVFHKVTEVAAEVLRVERVGIWLFIEQKTAFRCVDLFERSKGTHASGTTLQVRDYPQYFAALERRKSIPAEVALVDPRSIEFSESYLIPLGITSLLDCPIFVGGEVVGALCHEHIGPLREWTTEDRDFAGSMADLIALKLRAAELQEARIALRTQEAQLQEVRRTEQISQMAAGVAHDFKNLLMVIIGSSDLIQTEEGVTPAISELVKQISEAAQRGVTLAQELMDFARPTSQSAKVLSPATLIRDQMSQFQTSVGPACEVVLEAQNFSSRVLISPSQLERMILNLLINARDAMPNGGKITIGVESVIDKDPDGHTGPFVLIEVKDQGTGVAPEILSRIFDPFFSTKPRGIGTGLGLAVVNQIASFIGGFVRVESTVGVGTTFKIYLPKIASQE